MYKKHTLKVFHYVQKKKKYFFSFMFNFLLKYLKSLLLFKIQIKFSDNLYCIFIIKLCVLILSLKL